jgi:hypothetical protein
MEIRLIFTSKPVRPSFVPKPRKSLFRWKMKRIWWLTMCLPTDNGLNDEYPRIIKILNARIVALRKTL